MVRSDGAIAEEQLRLRVWQQAELVQRSPSRVGSLDIQGVSVGREAESLGDQVARPARDHERHVDGASRLGMLQPNGLVQGPFVRRPQKGDHGTVGAEDRPRAIALIGRRLWVYFCLERNLAWTLRAVLAERRQGKVPDIAQSRLPGVAHVSLDGSEDDPIIANIELVGRVSWLTYAQGCCKFCASQGISQRLVDLPATIFFDQVRIPEYMALRLRVRVPLCTPTLVSTLIGCC